VPVDTAINPVGDGKPHVVGASQIERSASHPPDAPQRTAARSRWARLLARIYEVFPLLCAECGVEMRILASITAAEPVDAILRHLGLPATPPPLSPARGPSTTSASTPIPAPTWTRRPRMTRSSPSPSRTPTSIRAHGP
jgi:hypothetical protein